MKFLITYLVLAFTLVTPHFSISQEIKKEKVYLLFEENNGEQPYYRGLKFKDENGLNFNLLISHGFVHKEEHTRDTLPIPQLNEFKITQEIKLKEIEKKWRKENEEALKKKFYGNFYKMINRNSVFDPYIIEKINNEYIVVYQVEFRNEGTIP